MCCCLFFSHFRSCAASTPDTSLQAAGKKPGRRVAFATSRGLTPAKRGELNEQTTLDGAAVYLRVSRRRSAAPAVRIRGFRVNRGPRWRPIPRNAKKTEKAARGRTRVGYRARATTSTPENDDTNQLSTTSSSMDAHLGVVVKTCGCKRVVPEQSRLLYSGGELPAHRTPRKGIFSNPTCI